MWFCRNCDCLEIDHFSCKICLHVFPTSAFSVYVVLIFCRYVFCYPCVYDFVKEYGKCPVTNYPARTDHLIKLYLDSSWWTDHQNFIWNFQMNWSSYKTLFRQLLINRSSSKTSFGQFWKPIDNKEATSYKPHGKKTCLLGSTTMIEDTDRTVNLFSMIGAISVSVIGSIRSIEDCKSSDKTADRSKPLFDTYMIIQIFSRYCYTWMGLPTFQPLQTQIRLCVCVIW